MMNLKPEMQDGSAYKFVKLPSNGVFKNLLTIEWWQGLPASSLLP